MLKTIKSKKPPKDERERLLLLGLVELYLKSGKPVGSNTLKENGFENLSSATIRNYCTKLEEAGYLKQQHSSGGRIPTPLAYKLYVRTCLSPGAESKLLSEKDKLFLRKHLAKEGREIASYLQRAAESISEITRCAVFLSAPRFDQDFVLDIKLVSLDPSRCLCVLITDFGLIHTETLYTEKKVSNFSLKRIEGYLRWKVTGLDKPVLNEEEELIAIHFYNEVMLRHIVNYTHFSAEDIYKTGFSKLLHYPDFNDASALANGLSLFENSLYLRTLLNECTKTNQLNCWISDDLYTIAPAATSCSVIAAPYRINQTTVGAIALLGPNRIPYRHLFEILDAAASHISDSLTKSIYKFKISFRQPKPSSVGFQQSSHQFLDQAHCLQLEDKRK